MKTCPFCAEEVQDAAVKCKHCHSRIDAPIKQPLAEAAHSLIDTVNASMAKAQEAVAKNKVELKRKADEEERDLVKEGYKLVLFSGREKVAAIKEEEAKGWILAHQGKGFRGPWAVFIRPEKLPADGLIYEYCLAAPETPTDLAAQKIEFKKEEWVFVHFLKEMPGRIQETGFSIFRRERKVRPQPPWNQRDWTIAAFMVVPLVVMIALGVTQIARAPAVAPTSNAQMEHPPKKTVSLEVPLASAASSSKSGGFMQNCPDAPPVGFKNYCSDAAGELRAMALIGRCLSLREDTFTRNSPTIESDCMTLPKGLNVQYTDQVSIRGTHHKWVSILFIHNNKLQPGWIYTGDTTYWQ